MPDNDNISDEFRKAIKEFGDCPDKLFNMAKTPFEKMVAIEFFNMYKKLENVENDSKWVKWLVCGLFMSIFINLIGLIT